jgi:adenylate cyclase
LRRSPSPAGTACRRRCNNQIGTKLPIGFTDLGEQQVKEYCPANPRLSNPRRGQSACVGWGLCPPLPDKPSIAVLPFANMSGDPEQEYFADGMVEEIIASVRLGRALLLSVD